MKTKAVFLNRNGSADWENISTDWQAILFQYLTPVVEKPCSKEYWVYRGCFFIHCTNRGGHNLSTIGVSGS